MARREHKHALRDSAERHRMVCEAIPLWGNRQPFLLEIDQLRLALTGIICQSLPSGVYCRTSITWPEESRISQSPKYSSDLKLLVGSDRHDNKSRSSRASPTAAWVKISTPDVGSLLRMVWM
jgi:hypothetical protein